MGAFAKAPRVGIIAAVQFAQKEHVQIVNMRGKAVTLASVILVLIVLALFWQPLLRFFSSAQGLREWVLGFGVLAPLALILLNVVQVVIAPLPGDVVNALGGYLFGVWRGTTYGLIGVLCGAGLAFSLARHLGDPFLRLLFSDQQLSQWRGASRVNSISTWILLLILPSGDVSYFIAGVAALPLGKFLLAVLITHVPTVFLGSLVGAQVLAMSPSFIFVAIAIALLVASGGYLIRDRLWALLYKRVLRPVLEAARRNRAS